MSRYNQFDDLIGNLKILSSLKAVHLQETDLGKVFFSTYMDGDHLTSILRDYETMTCLGYNNGRGNWSPFNKIINQHFAQTTSRSTLAFRVP